MKWLQKHPKSGVEENGGISGSWLSNILNSGVSIITVKTPDWYTELGE
jgi:hypothetical protein